MKETIIFIILGALVLWVGINYAPKIEQMIINKNIPERVSEQLIKEDLVVGTGGEAKLGDTVSVHYVGTLLNGEEFDSSLDRGQPFEFTIGEGQVIKGWEQGVPGMKVGGKRKLTIPSSLAYGERSPSPKIPANSALVFEVELLEIK